MCRQRFEALTFSRKYKWFFVNDSKALRQVQKCVARVGGPFGGPRAIKKDLHTTVSLCDHLFVIIICLVGDMTR